MLKSDEPNHEYFEELSALAALGQVTPGEFQQLQAHVSSCSSCRIHYREFVELLHEYLPVVDPLRESSPNMARQEAGVRERFLKRAAREGIQFSEEVWGNRKKATRLAGPWVGLSSWVWQPPRLAYSLSLVIMAVIIGLMGLRMHRVDSRNLESAAEMAKLNAQLSKLRPSGLPLVAPLLPTASGESMQQTETIKLATIQQELDNVRRDYAAALAKSKTLDEQLQRAASELSALRLELVAVRSQTPSPDNKGHETELALRQANEELARLRQERLSIMATANSQQAQIRDLTDRLNTQGEAIDHHRELAATTREIRDLMGARNLHIIDVADVDNRGTKKPFGRVFYTEGRSLIFYAYDLEKMKKSLEKFSFQAWGQRESRPGSVQSLGVFATDDQSQNRWVLKYDDPTILAQIDSVFVTVEPRGGSTKPKGQQLMYAYLKASANHP